MCPGESSKYKRKCPLRHIVVAELGHSKPRRGSAQLEKFLTIWSLPLPASHFALPEREKV